MTSGPSPVLRSLGRLAAAAAHVLHGLWVAGRRPAGLAIERQADQVQWWARRLLDLLGISVTQSGAPTPGPCLLVANHVSWLDIVALHAVCPQARFVSKADVKRWPLVGRLTGAARTLFIERERKRDAMRVVHHVAEALRAGDVVAVFPEGTTSDGHGVLPFHANLLQAAIVTSACVQPVALRYAEPGHRVSPAAAYVGDTSLLQSLWWVARARGLQVHLQWMPAVRADGHDRRSLAQTLRQTIEAALD